MRIVQINSVACGSTGTIAKKLSAAMTAEGIDNRIFYGIGSSDFPHAEKFGDNFSLRIHQVATRFWDQHGAASRRPTKKILSALDAFAPDAVHLHNIHGFYLNFPLLFSYLKARQLPVIWTMHDCWAFTGHCAHFEQFGCTKYRSGCGHCPGLSAYPKSYFTDRSRQNFKEKETFFTSLDHLHIVAPSHWLRSKLSESFFRNTPVQVIHNGISLARFSPQKVARSAALEGKKIYLGIAAQWTKDKGIQDFLAMAKLLHQDELILLVGDGPSDLPENILRYPRTKTAEELIDYYRMADVFLNPTHCDTFPTVNMEALACGLPVVTYDVGGSGEIPDSATGAAVKKGDIAALLSAARRFTSSENVAAACALRAKAHFSEEQQISSYLKLYKEIGGKPI